MWLARLLFILIALSNWTAVHAKERMALVIGNADYTSSALVNSVNDAEDIASTLENLDFGVTLVKNATRGQMQAVISEFVGNLNDDTVGLFYYSGHAVQYKGNNYLIPIGTIDKLDRVEDLPKNTINTNTVLDGVNQSQSNLNFVFLDACRDNPFKNLSKEITPGLAESSANRDRSNKKLTMKGMHITRGVSGTHEQVKDTKGILVAHSTMPGNVSFDGDGGGRNSPYTKSLLKHISTENSLVFVMLSDVQQDVQRSTNGSQIPIFTSAITGRFCFNEINNGCGKAVVNIHSSYLKGLKDIQELTLLDGSSYKGQILDGKPHGKGIQIHMDGDRYEGWWKEGDYHGFGILVNAIGRYEGNFSRGLPNGKGVEVWSNGHRYEGEWKDNKRHGKGLYSWIDGSSHEGEWKDGNEHGFGILRNIHKGLSFEANFMDGYPAGKTITKLKGVTIEYQIDSTHNIKKIYDSEKEIPMKYFNGRVIINSSLYSFDGNIKNGNKDGFGIQKWSTGDRYEGEWKNNKQHGKGIVSYSSGGRYDGFWIENEFHGFGIFNSSGGHRYEGIWKKGKMNGHFIVNTSDGDRYKGEMVDNLYHGQGAYNWINGNSYMGGWNNGVRSGSGIFLYKDIDPFKAGEYVGEFKNDVRHGFGVMTWENGDRYEGGWKNNKYHGNGLATTSDGYRYEGKWSNGKEVDK